MEVFENKIDFLKEEIIRIIYMNTDEAYFKKIEEDFKDITHHSDVSYSSHRFLSLTIKSQ